MQFPIILFLLICFSTLTKSQSWDSNFYDTKVLYDNADLLQLDEYEKLKLKSQEIERNRVVPKDNLDFYDFEAPPSSYVESSSSDVDTSVDKKNNVKRYSSFSSVVDKVNETKVTNNVTTNNKVYFIDF